MNRDRVPLPFDPADGPARSYGCSWCSQPTTRQSNHRTTHQRIRKAATLSGRDIAPRSGWFSPQSRRA